MSVTTATVDLDVLKKFAEPSAAIHADAPLGFDPNKSKVLLTKARGKMVWQAPVVVHYKRPKKTVGDSAA